MAKHPCDFRCDVVHETVRIRLCKKPVGGMSSKHVFFVQCDQSELCPVREPLRKVHEGILRLLSSITIADMASDDMPIPTIPSMVSSIQPTSAQNSQVTRPR